MRGIYVWVLAISMLGCVSMTQAASVSAAASKKRSVAAVSVQNPQSAPMDVAAFVDAYAQGPVNKPVFVTSISQFEKVFGKLNTTAGADNRAALQVLQFFLNGGSKAWINRIVPPNWVGTKENQTGIYALTGSFNILVLPGIATLKEPDGQPARQAALAFVSDRNAFLIVDPPSGFNYDALVAWRNGASELLNQKHAAAYFPRVRVADPASGGKGRFLEPSGSMAGILANRDVWVAPANTSIVGAIDVEYKIDDVMNQALNAPTNGVAINVIRMFPTPGLLVWGARTLNGNSQDYRYIQCERTYQLIELSVQSIFQSFAFQANNASTWTAVQSSVSNFLMGLWKQGALVGAKLTDAFSVSIGLGTTMTAQDILNGNMLMSVMVAVTSPAEFMALTFQQQVPIPAAPPATH